MGKPVRYVSILALLLVVLAIASPAPTRAAVSISETFMNSTAPGWQLLGNATLTSGTVDPVGDGWLRLTDNTGGQAGSAIYNTPFSSSDGIRVEFEYATYGGTGADGFSFYLIDGATTSPTVGGAGGSLGYSRGVVSNIPGVTNGYVGIGLDEFGNFVTPLAGDCNPSCPPQRVPQSVAIRGSGSLNTGFNYLIHVPLAPQTIDNVSRANARPVRITIVNQKITVELDFRDGAGFQTIIDQYDLQTAAGQVAIPATFKMGFSGSTGGSTNFHEIRTLTVNGSRTTSTTLTSAPNPSTSGQAVTFTATTSGTGGTPTGTVTFLEGTTPLGTGTLDGSGQAVFTTSSLAVGSHTITAQYEGDSTFGISSSAPLTQTVVSGVVSSDLSVTQSYYIRYVSEITFTLTASNLGPNPADGATVSDTFPAAGGSIPWTWTCTASNGATCAASGTGNISDTLASFPSGGVVTYTVSGQLASWSRWTNTVDITAPSAVTDSDPSNNSVTAGRYQILLPVIAK